MFTYCVQLAGYHYDQYDQFGEISSVDFIKVLDEFPWIEQFNRWNDLQTGCSATIFVLDNVSETVLWVSIAEKEKKPIYLIGIIFSKAVESFFGLGKQKLIRWMDIYELNALDLTKQYFKMFFNNMSKELIEKLSLEKKVESTKTANTYPWQKIT